jgi:hypothetical protein
MSRPEQHAFLLLAYNPAVFDLQEGRMLSIVPRQHPLTNHLLAKHLLLPHFRGTADVMDRLGVLKKHPSLVVKRGPDPADWYDVPVPYLGDFLLFLKNSDGDPYCVNWTVKEKESQFKSKNPQVDIDPQRQKEIELIADLRHKIEELYYQDAGIRTVRVTDTAITPMVTANLKMLFGWHKRSSALPHWPISHMQKAFASAMRQRIAPLKILGDMAQKFGCTRHTCMQILYAAIWNRTLRVDLYKPILIDSPLHEEKVDVLDAYSHWFMR